MGAPVWTVRLLGVRLAPLAYRFCSRVPVRLMPIWPHNSLRRLRLTPLFSIHWGFLAVFGSPTNALWSGCRGHESSDSYPVTLPRAARGMALDARLEVLSAALV